MKINFTLASILGFLSILLGAFGAHALKNKLSLEALNSFETAVRYMMYHTIVILVINSFSGFSEKIKNRISFFFFIGILFFSGSIFVITAGIPAKYIWFITPLGGALLIAGWVMMILSFLRIKNNNS